MRSSSCGRVVLPSRKCLPLNSVRVRADAVTILGSDEHVRYASDARAAPPPAAHADDEYLSLRALAHYASVSVRTLRGYLGHRPRPLPHFRMGGKILVKRSEFDDWMDQFRVADDRAADTIVADILRSL